MPTRPSAGEMRMEQAEQLRDMKREGGACRWGLCTNGTTHTIEYNGRSYTVCQEHYDEHQQTGEVHLYGVDTG